MYFPMGKNGFLIFYGIKPETIWTLCVLPPTLWHYSRVETVRGNTLSRKVAYTFCLVWDVSAMDKRLTLCSSFYYYL